MTPTENQPVIMNKAQVERLYPRMRQLALLCQDGSLDDCGKEEMADLFKDLDATAGGGVIPDDWAHNQNPNIPGLLDPDCYLTQLQVLAERIMDGDSTRSDEVEFAGMFLALDEHLTDVGLLPAAWSK